MQQIKYFAATPAFPAKGNRRIQRKCKSFPLTGYSWDENPKDRFISAGYTHLFTKTPLGEVYQSPNKSLERILIAMKPVIINTKH